MYQKLILVGNLGRDPEMRYLPSGKEVTSFSMATSEKWSGQDGQQNERTTWWNISVYGKAGLACNEYLKKGSKILVEGKVKADPKTGNPRIWQGQDGNSRANFEVDAITVKFLSTRQTGGPISGEQDTELVGADETEIPF